MKKASFYISLFLFGIIAGIVIFAKYIDQPDYQYQVTIKKLKSKGNVGENSGIIPHIDLNIEDEETGEVKKKKGFLKNLFKRNDNRRKGRKN